MAEQKPPKQAVRSAMTGQERLALRISTMISSPRAQLERCVRVHRLDTDSDEAWGEVMETLAGTEGVEMTHHEDGDVTLRWALAGEHDQVVEEGELVAVEESPF